MKHLGSGILATVFILLCILTTAGKTSRVQVGYCGPIKEIDAAKAAGFDYMEIRTSEIAALSDEDFTALLGKTKRLGLPTSSAYLFIPADIKLTGLKIDIEQQTKYLEKALDRVSQMGVQVITFGSGPARQVPDGFSKEEGFQQLVEFGKRLGPMARAKNITIAIEPQRKQECNIINSTAEALKWVKAVNDPNIQLMIDFYHFSVEKEDPAIILEAKDHIRHIHMANPEGRVFPLKWEEYNYAPFFQNLRKIGYDRRIGLEAKSTDFQKESPIAIALLRRAFEGN
jgi:D-psicose/D-tagatose/L-ribulose 3-epimerase